MLLDLLLVISSHGPFCDCCKHFGAWWVMMVGKYKTWLKQQQCRRESSLFPLVFLLRLDSNSMSQTLAHSSHCYYTFFLGRVWGEELVSSYLSSPHLANTQKTSHKKTFLTGPTKIPPSSTSSCYLFILFYYYFFLLTLCSFLYGVAIFRRKRVRKKAGGCGFLMNISCHEVVGLSHFLLLYQITTWFPTRAGWLVA